MQWQLLLPLYGVFIGNKGVSGPVNPACDSGRLSSPADSMKQRLQVPQSSAGALINCSYRLHTHTYTHTFYGPQFIFLKLKGTSANSSLLSLSLSGGSPDRRSSLRVWSVTFLQAPGCDFSHRCPIRLFVADKPRLTPEPSSSHHHRTWHQTDHPPAQSISAHQA